MESSTVVANDATALRVRTCGAGPDLLVLSGGPGCVNYLADRDLAPDGFTCWFPDPRGVDASEGGPHDMARAVADLEDVRRAIGTDSWIVLGHSWGSDLAVRYAIDHPAGVRGVVGIAGHGLHRDREWSAAYEAGRATAVDPVEIRFVPEVHEALWDSFKEWIHQPRLWRRLADSPVPMRFVAAGADIRPDWPIRQLANLVPDATFEVVDDVVHDFWFTDPDTWRAVCTRAAGSVARPSR